MRRKVIKVKSNAKAKIIILIALGILFALLPLITVNLSFITGNSNKSLEYSDDINIDNKNPKISDVSGKIHIANNWTAAKAAGICTGSGNYTHPYIIEDLVIDAGGSGSCIRIENSDFYFRIENCTLYNTEWSYPNAGISLYNVDNGTLIDNNCSSNNYGIYLYSGDNNTISGNIANNNRYYGIDLRYSTNNVITGNTVNNNSADGIHLYVCNDINVTGNSIINNDGNGIHFYRTDNNIITENIVDNNTGDGIHFYDYYYYDYDCNNNIVLGNNISNSYYGIYLSGVNNTLSGNRMVECGLKIYGYLEDIKTHIIDASNLVNGKPLYYYVDEVNLGLNDFTNAGQIILVNCEHSLIFNLNVSCGSTGIALIYSDNNNISENIANNNRDNGIYLIGSNNNYISGNNASNNYNGLYLHYSNGNNLSRNIANNNTGYGIYMCSNWGSTHGVSHILENDASHNYFGINLYYLQGAIISGNNVSYNHYGIYLDWDSQKNNVSGNNISFNNYGILLEGDNNIILGNIVDNNEIGISLSFCQSNNIQQNVISNNDIGIDIILSRCNIISDNIFSGNIIDIRGTQLECNPFPLGFVIAIVFFIVFIAIVVTAKISKKRRVTKYEVARYYEPKEQKIRVMEVLEEKEKPVPVKIEPSKSTVEQILLKEETIKEVVKEPISQDVFVEKEKPVPVKIEPSKSTVEQILLKEETIKEVVKEPISHEVLEEKEKPVPVKIEPPQPKILNCAFCGMEVDAERNFCQQCGHKLKKS